MGNENKKTVSIELKTLIIIALVLLNGVLIFLLVKQNIKAVPTIVNLEDKQYEVTIEYLKKQLNNISELSTAEMTYSSVCTIEEGKIPLLTQKGYSMLYTGIVKAGIDSSKIRISIEDNEVVVKLPKAEIQMVKVEPDSIKFYDQKKALFNWTELQDSIDGVKIAEDDLGKQADKDSLLKKADEQAENIVKGLLGDIIKEAKGQRSLRVIHED